MTDIYPAEARARIRVTVQPGHILEGETGASVGAFLEAAEAHYGSFGAPVMAAVADGVLRELNTPLHRDAEIAPITMAHSDGIRIYRRSLVMLMVTAAYALWQARVSVRYAVPDGGYYCTRIDGGPPFTPDELAQLRAQMRQMVHRNYPITRRVVAVEEASAIFETRGEWDKVRLLDQRARPVLALYTLQGYEDYYYGYMVPSTGCLKWFDLLPVPDGFVLQYPVRENLGMLRTLRAYDKLDVVFKESDEWLRRIGVEDVGRLNAVVSNENRLQEIVLVAEALHEGRIAAIAAEIRRRHAQDGVRLVLVAGPSSSGKTTFAKRLAIQLLAHGLRPFTLELDNYFVDRDMTPRDASGDYDFESLGAIDLRTFNAHLLELIAGGEVLLPRFDFLVGKRVPGHTVRLSPGQVLIVEGIHGLNPNLVPDIPPQRIHRVYASALTQLNIDAHNRVPTTDSRLLRRIVRDARTRGWDAAATLNRWESVRRGEKANIFPYQENADSFFNSALVYELAALRPLAEPLLLQVEPGTPEHLEARRLLSFLSWVQPMTPAQLEDIPDTSLLREFIGFSTLEHYVPSNIDGAEGITGRKS